MIEYRHSKFIIGIDTEKNLGSGFTGLNSRAGDLLCIHFKHKNSLPSTYATQVYITLHTDNILEIRDTGVSVYD